MCGEKFHSRESLFRSSSTGSGLDVARGLVCSNDPGERYRLELAPGRATLGGPVSRVGSRQTKTPACRYAARWQPHQPTILRRANNPPRRNPLVTKLIRKRSRTAQHGNGPQPAPDQRVRINLRHSTRVATWNVQTLHRPGYATLLSRELCRYNITLAGLCEVRWQGNGEITAGDHCYIWSGPERRTGLYGVALAIPMALRKSLISWTPMSDRLLSARFLHQHGKLTVIVAYAPTNVADEDVKDAFWDQLHQAVGQAPPHDITIILTDANATLSSSDRSTGSPVGTTFADRTTNNGNRLLLLCHHNNLCVADTWFPRKRIHHWTWYSPDGRTGKALDHILISRRWKSSVTNCRVYRGAELGNTDHRLLVAQLKLKLRANQHSQTQPRLESSLFSDPNIATGFSQKFKIHLVAIHQFSTDLEKKSNGNT
uniref:Endonuclease/exonuclease/phosphatase domain-containing protein n=1 Tax=Amphiprion percula TaxID=161767 RepID=A0A3P8SEE9_AMPPE